MAFTCQRRHGCLQLCLVLSMGLVAFASHAPYHAASAKGAVRTLMSQIIERTTWDNDIITMLTEPQRRAWGFENSNTLQALADHVTHLTPVLDVEIKLVGFGRDPHPRPDHVRINEHEFERHLQALHMELPSVVLHPQEERMVVSPQVSWHVSHVALPLHSRLQAAIRKGLETHKARQVDNHHVHALELPVHTVDDVLVTDDRAHTFTIYVINPNLPSDEEEYAYSYDAPPDPSTQVHRPQKSCAGPYYISPTKNYLWIDLHAGPVFFGPGAGGHGQVFAHTLPRPSRYKPATASKAILPDLAALALSALRHLAWPAVEHSQAQFFQTVRIQVIHMHEGLSTPPPGLSSDIIHQELQAAVQGVQVVEVTEKYVPFASCDLCVLAWTSAVKKATVRDERSALHAAKTVTKVDSVVLHEMLTKFQDGIFGFADVAVEPHEGQGHRQRTLPVFVVHSNSIQSVLLDGLHKAVSFPNMAIAVVGKAHDVPLPFTCGFHTLVTDQTVVTREVLGAVLATGWAVADPSYAYSPASGVLQDYRWALGPNPFGPQSGSTTLGAGLRNAALRNIGLLQLNASVTRFAKVLHGLSKLSSNGRLDGLGSKEVRPTLVQRANLAMFLADEAASLLVNWQPAKALKYTRQLQQVLHALEARALRIAKTYGEGQLHCSGGPGKALSMWWAPAGALACWPLAWLLRRRTGRVLNKYDKII